MVSTFINGENNGNSNSKIQPIAEDKIEKENIVCEKTGQGEGLSKGGRVRLVVNRP